MTEGEKGIPERLAPVAAAERIAAVDVVRGLALLGILIINIDFFALPDTVYFDPSSAGDLTGLNLLTWQVAMTLFEYKMMALFSMLFGAGLILMHSRAEAIGRRFAGIYYRRVFWLLMFGLAHAYLLWMGDILYAYAMCGLILYPLRRRSPRFLLNLGIVLLLLGSLIKLGTGYSFELLRDANDRVQSKLEAGEAITARDEALVAQWEEVRTGFKASPEAVQRQVEAYRGGFKEVFQVRAPQSFVMQTQLFLFMVLWRVGGLMLIGMALMKLGVFSGQRSRRFYVWLMVVGFGLGLPLAYLGMSRWLASDFDFVQLFQVNSHFNYFGSILAALGYVGLIITIYNRGWLTWLTARLAAVGRTALSNYLLQSIICTTIFYGYGLGLYARFDRFALQWFVLAVWIVQLIVSPIWLARFRFGPAEWLWRSLTYWKRQPMKTVIASHEG